MQSFYFFYDLKINKQTREHGKKTTSITGIVKKKSKKRKIREKERARKQNQAKERIKEQNQQASYSNMGQNFKACMQQS